MNRILGRPAFQWGPSGCLQRGVGGMREPRNHCPDPGLRGQVSGGGCGRPEAERLGDRLCLSRWLTVPYYFCFLPPPQAGLCSLFFPQRTCLRPGGVATWPGERSQLWGQIQGSSTQHLPQAECGQVRHSPSTASALSSAPTHQGCQDPTVLQSGPKPPL